MIACNGRRAQKSYGLALLWRGLLPAPPCHPETYSMRSQVTYFHSGGKGGANSGNEERPEDAEGTKRNTSDNTKPRVLRKNIP